MKKVAGIIFLAILLVTFGCGKSQTPQEKFQKKMTEQMEKLQANVDKLTKAYADKTAAMKKQFQAQMDKAQKEYHDGMAALHAKQEAAKKELAALKSATGKAWEKAKVQMEKSAAELEKTFQDLKAKLH
jgi:altronate dehydratase